MDGTDIFHVHFTQDTPECPLNMRLLHYDEVELLQTLKRASTPDDLPNTSTEKYKQSSAALICSDRERACCGFMRIRPRCHQQCRSLAEFRGPCRPVR